MLVTLSGKFRNEAELCSLAIGSRGLGLGEREVEGIIWDNRFSREDAAYKVLQRWMNNQENKLTAYDDLW